MTDTRTPGLAGVWVLILALVLSAGHAHAEPQFPTLTGRVVDAADILAAAVKNALTDKLEAHEDATTNQVVVVTLPSLQGYAIEDFGYQLGRHWGIGQAERNNGALLIVAPNERKVRIEVGYGLEGSLTDALSKTIIETEILPAFRTGAYGTGVTKGVDAILAAIAGTYEAKPLKRKSRKSDREIPPLIRLLLILAFVPFVVFLLGRDERRGGWSGRSGGGGFSGGGGGGGGGFSGGGGFGGGGASGGW